MRVPESSKVNLALQGLNKSSAKANEITEQIASGKRINRPSDDPVGSAKVEAFKSSIIKNENTLKNLNLDRMWLDAIDTSTDRMVEILRYAKVKALEGANSFQSPESLGAIAAEVEALQSELLDLGNTKVDNLYIYSGSKTFTAPLAQGWPYQLPGVRGVDNLIRSKVPIDDLFIKNLAVGDDFDDEPAKLMLEFSSYWNDPTTDNQNATAPPTGAAASGTASVNVSNNAESSNPLALNNPNDSAYGYSVPISRKDSAQTIVDKLNLALAGKYFYEKSADFPSGFKQDAHAYLGPDGHIYLQSMPNVSTSFSKASNKLLAMETAANLLPEILPKDEQSAGYYGDYAAGFTDHPLIVRITKAGNIGQAQYSVSDDGGKSWSQNRQLGWQNEIYNPEGLASKHVQLNFVRASEARYLPENLEFLIAKNPSVIYQGNEQARITPQDNSYKTQINITAKQLFFTDEQHKNSVTVFDILERLKNNVASGALPEIGKQIAELDLAIDQVLKLRASSGITTKTIDNAQARIEQKNVETVQAMSELEDADLAKAASDLNLNAVQRQAMMETTARIIQPSLVQFLR